MVAKNRSIERDEATTPFLNETVDNKLQCLMKRLEFHFFVEIEEQSTGFQCLFYKNISLTSVKMVSKKSVTMYSLDMYGRPKPVVVPKLCQDLKTTEDGVYTINPFGKEIQVFCDMTRHGGGWTTLQRRFDGSTDFKKYWVYYKEGFGNPDGEYWIGLENIYQMTNTFQNVMVRIEATALDDRIGYLIFKNFYIDGENVNYKLHSGSYYEGNYTMRTHWTYHNNMYFSTRDRDNDQYVDSCSNISSGRAGGWYKSCSMIHLNGNYAETGDGSRFMHWRSLSDRTVLKSISLSIKVEE